jgi:hypothetical protein
MTWSSSIRRDYCFYWGFVGGSSAAITGLTKRAKLDFFVRYPDFFNAVIGQGNRRRVDEAPR